ncbi:PAS domain S-box protein [Microvirga roseola]|uniref:PAS domain S-box protein n=1 Tax=Microvirga roseola TaxID=2883126 RepID=UPI001E5BC8C2|nr:PAS domain S-box protein [Microvirga roseola]
MGEERYRTLFQSIDEGFCILQMIFAQNVRPIDYRFVETNGVFERQTGLKEAVGRTVRELVPDLEPFWIDTYGRVALTGEPVRFVEESKPMGRWFDVCAFRIGDPGERHVALLFNDITGRKRAERTLAESEARYSAALAIAQFGTFEWNLITNEVVLDDRSREIFGFAPGKGRTAQEVLDRVDPVDLPRGGAGCG